MAETMVRPEIGSGFTRETVEALSRRRNEPDWLLQARLDAFERWQQTPYPSTDEEAWRRFDAESIDFDGCASVAVGSETEGSEAPTDDNLGGWLTFRDGALVNAHLAPELAARGVRFMGLRDALRKHPELVREHFMTQVVKPDESKFTLLHAAFWTDGVFLHVPRGVAVAAPLLARIELSQGHASHFHHTLVIADDRAEVTLTEQFDGGGRGEAIAYPIAEILAGRGAQVHYGCVQLYQDDVHELGVRRAHVAADAHADLLIGDFGGRYIKDFVGATLTGRGADCRLEGCYFPEHGQIVDLVTLQDHQTANGTSNLLFKGAVADGGESIFRGIIVVEREAQQTDAYQTNNNLLLGDEARADSMPVLEILADDVRCSHGATLGHVDEGDLFYLCSRGLARFDAERLLIAGFFEDILARLPVPSVRQAVDQTLAERITHRLAREAEQLSS